MNGGWRVVLQVDTPRRCECLRFSDIPVVDPAHIAIVAENQACAARAERLYRRLKSALTGLSSSPALSCGGPRLLGCMARGEPTCLSLLVPITDTHRISVVLADLMRDWRARRPYRSRVLPILPAGSNPESVLPLGLSRLTCLVATGPIEQLASDVLLAAEVGGAQYRIFVSYRRADSQQIAEQLHDELTHAGFRVFLDRFRGTPGRPFPRVLAEELADKGLVLVLESPSVRRSPWTLAEVAYARALRLGLLALTLPGGQAFATIPGRDRYSPAPGDFASSGTDPALTQNGLRGVIKFVREGYAEQMLYRQLYLENLLHRSLRSLSVTAQGGSCFRISGGRRDYLLHLSSRPPRVGEVRRAVVSGGTPLHSVVVGAHRYLPPKDQENLTWVTDQLGVSLVSEARLPRLESDLQMGRAPL